jgi:hypothetical protein
MRLSIQELINLPCDNRMVPRETEREMPPRSPAMSTKFNDPKAISEAGRKSTNGYTRRSKKSRALESLLPSVSATSQQPLVIPLQKLLLLTGLSIQKNYLTYFT